MFPVVTVESEVFELFEQLGTKSKFWYDESRSLFKAGRPGTGENWAEVVASRIARGLGLPHAHYDLAETTVTLLDWEPEPNGMTRGVTTPNFTPRGGRLILGNELIVNVSSAETTKTQNRRSQHTVPRLAGVMKSERVQIPQEWESPRQVQTAGGVMAGYLMLDVLIGNQDRHEENWGILARPGHSAPTFELAPTFDHASSMGRNETDQRRLQKLHHKNPAHGVAGYAARALSQLHDRSGKRTTTLSAFKDFSEYFPEESRYWIAQLSRMTELSFRILMNEVPEGWISETTRDFASEILVENRRRLLQAGL